MRYSKIRKMDIADGPGVRVSVFLQGCDFNCKNCFNPETHDFNGGKELTNEIIDDVINLCGNENVKGLSILGGEPMNPINEPATEILSKKFKEHYPDKDVWVWSGYSFENYLEKQPAMKYIDVIVDGQYVDELHNPTLKWRGSSNQRVIDVPKSLKSNKVVLFCEWNFSLTFILVNPITGNVDEKKYSLLAFAYNMCYNDNYVALKKECDYLF